MVLISQLSHHIQSQSRIGEHADLVGDVGPVVNRTQILQVLHQGLSAFGDSGGHLFDFPEPHLVQFLVVQHNGNDVGPVLWRVGIDSSCDQLQLGHDVGDLVFGVAHQTHAPHSLPVEPEVFSETLGQENWDFFVFSEVPQGEGINLDGSTGEPLVGHIEEGDVLLLFHQVFNLFPLGRGRVHSSRVVSSGVEADQRLVWSFVDILEHSL